MLWHVWGFGALIEDPFTAIWGFCEGCDRLMILLEDREERVIQLADMVISRGSWSAYVLHRAKKLSFNVAVVEITSDYVWFPFVHPDGPSGEFGNLGWGGRELGGYGSQNEPTLRPVETLSTGLVVARCRGAEASARLVGYGGREGSEV